MERGRGNVYKQRAIFARRECIKYPTTISWRRCSTECLPVAIESVKWKTILSFLPCWLPALLSDSQIDHLRYVQHTHISLLKCYPILSGRATACCLISFSGVSTYFSRLLFSSNCFLFYFFRPFCLSVVGLDFFNPIVCLAIRLLATSALCCCCRIV